MKIRKLFASLVALLPLSVLAAPPPPLIHNAVTTNQPAPMTNVISGISRTAGASVFQRGSANLTNWSALSTNVIASSANANWATNLPTGATVSGATVTNLGTDIFSIRLGNAAVTLNNLADEISTTGTLVSEGGFIGNGASISNINATNITSGNVAPARLGTNAATAGYVLATDGTTLFYKEDSTADPGGSVDAPTAAAIARATMTTNAAGFVDSIATNPVPAANLTGTIADARLSTNINSLGAVYNVRTYGAVGDGVTDDGAAIQAAMDAAGLAGGGVVWFPPGKYGVTDTTTYPTYLLEGAKAPILFRTNNVFLVGQDRDSCQIVSLAAVVSHGGYQMIGGGPPDPQSAAGFTNFGIINLTIDGAGQTDWYDMTQIYKCTNTIFKNVTFKNLGGTADLIDVQFGGEVHIENCRFESFKENAVSGQNSLIVIRNCYIDCIGHGTTSDIIEVPGTTKLIVEGTIFVNSVPITAASSGSYCPLYGMYKNCQFFLSEHDLATFIQPTGTELDFQNCSFYTQNSPEDGTSGPDSMTAPIIDTIGGISLIVKNCTFSQYTYPLRIRAILGTASIIGNFFNGSTVSCVVRNVPCGVLFEGNTFNMQNTFGIYGDSAGTNIDNLQIVGNWFGASCTNIRLDTAGTNVQIRANQFIVNTADLFGQLGANKIIATDNSSPSGSVTLATSGNILRGNKLGNLSVSVANAGIVENNIINQFGGSGGNYSSLKTNRNYKFDFTAWNANDDNVNAYALASHNQPAATITNAGTLIYSNSVAMTNAGLQTALDATNNLGAGHIKSGTIATARLGSGTANGTTVLRGDSTWGTAGVGDVVAANDNVLTGSNTVSYLFLSRTNYGPGTNAPFMGATNAAKTYTDQQVTASTNQLYTTITNSLSVETLDVGTLTITNGFTNVMKAASYFTNSAEGWAADMYPPSGYSFSTPSMMVTNLIIASNNVARLRFLDAGNEANIYYDGDLGIIGVVNASFNGVNLKDNSVGHAAMSEESTNAFYTRGTNFSRDASNLATGTVPIGRLATTLQNVSTNNTGALTNQNGYALAAMADTNWVLGQIASLGSYIYFGGPTNSASIKENGVGDDRTNVWQGSISPFANAATQTVSTLVVDAYARNIISTNTFSAIAAGPISIVSYPFRTGSGTVSGKWEIYYVTNGVAREIASGAEQTIATGTGPQQQITSLTITNSYTFAVGNEAKIMLSFKITSAGTGGPTLSWAYGGSYDGHITFTRPLSSATINVGQIAGAGNLIYSNAATARVDMATNASYATNWTQAGTLAYSNAATARVDMATNAANATNFFGTLTTNNVTGAPTENYIPKIQANGTIAWAADATGGAGGGGTNAQTSVLSFSDTNVLIDLTTPAGVSTNSPRTFFLTLTTNALIYFTGTYLNGQEVKIWLQQDSTGSRRVWLTNTCVGGDTVTLPADKELTISTTPYYRSAIKLDYFSWSNQWNLIAGPNRGYY